MVTVLLKQIPTVFLWNWKLHYNVQQARYWTQPCRDLSHDFCSVKNFRLIFCTHFRFQKWVSRILSLTILDLVTVTILRSEYNLLSSRYITSPVLRHVISLWLNKLIYILPANYDDDIKYLSLSPSNA